MSQAKPTKEIDLETTFNINSSMLVYGFEDSSERVPEIDSTYAGNSSWLST